MTKEPQRKRGEEKPDINEYRLACFLKTKPKHLEIKLMRTISTTEMESITQAIGQLGDFSHCCALYEICEKNYQEILSYNTAIKNDFPANRNRDYEYAEEVYQEMNRLLLNYLTSFKTFIDHLTTRYTRLQEQGGSFLSDFRKITAACYDGNFAYRFFSKLRDYIQHCGMPFGSMSITEQPAPDGSVDINILTGFSRDTLIRTYKKWGKVKADLEKQPEQMALIPYLNGFHSQIKLINIVVSGMEISLASESWQSLYKLMQEVIAKNPNGTPAIVRYVEPVMAKYAMRVTRFPFHTMKKFQGKIKEVQNFKDQRKAARESPPSP